MHSPNFASYSFPLPLSQFNFPCFFAFSGKYPLPWRCPPLQGANKVPRGDNLSLRLGCLGASTGVMRTQVSSLHHLFGSLFYHPYIQTDDSHDSGVKPSRSRMFAKYSPGLEPIPARSKRQGSPWPARPRAGFLHFSKLLHKYGCESSSDGVRIGIITWSLSNVWKWTTFSS